MINRSFHLQTINNLYCTVVT